MPFEAPEGALFRLGADWGYSKDPSVLVRAFIGRWEGEPGASTVTADPKGRTLFVDHEAYLVGCTIDHLPALFADQDVRQPPRWPNPFGYRGVPGAARLKITADSARPETIAHLRSRGFNIVGAAKGKGSVEDGVAVLQSYDLVVHPRCRHLTDELIHYSWKVDKLSGEVLPQLTDSHNHAIDALRYAMEGSRAAGVSKFACYSAGPRISLQGYSGSPGTLDNIRRPACALKP